MDGLPTEMAVEAAPEESPAGVIRAESNEIRSGGRFYFTVPVGASP